MIACLPARCENEWMIIRRETPEDHSTVHAIHVEAFGRDLESRILTALRKDEAWLPELSLVAVEGDRVVGHVVCTTGSVDGRPGAVGLGPIAVDPAYQGAGTGRLLVHAVLSAADALGVAMVVLVGDPKFYGRCGFVSAETFGVEPPVESYRPYLQVRVLSAYTADVRGRFEFAGGFDEAVNS